jgi:hypothetical protein
MSFYTISDKENRNAIWVKNHNPKNVEYQIKLAYEISHGSIWYDIVSTGHANVYLISSMMKDIIENNGFSGCRFSHASIFQNGEPIRDDYYLLAITGKAGPIDNEKSERISVTYKSGVKGIEFKGLFFSEESWDGSDFFTPEGLVLPFVVSRVKNAIEKTNITNVKFVDASEVMRMVL